MIDIFAQPDLYIADIQITAITKIDADLSKMTFKEKEAWLKKNRDSWGELKTKHYQQTRKAMPVLLINDEFPSNKYMRWFIKKNFGEIPDGDVGITVKFENIKFSCRINYNFEMFDE